MNTSNIRQPIEAIDHHTQSRPFGIYHIYIPTGETCALYIHCHTEPEFFCLKLGTLDFVIEDTHYTLNAGDCIFVPPMLIHGAYKEESVECSFTAIVFSTEVISSYYAAPPYISYLSSGRQQCVYQIGHDNPAHQRLLSVLSFLPDSDEYDMNTNELTIVGSLFIICQELYNLCFSQVKENESSRALNPAIEYIKNHFCEQITLKNLAGVTGFSESYFGHFFTDKMGISPFAYINKVRIAYAASLLMTTSLSVTEIAAMSGYDNISYFNRTFRKIMGVTPSSYRAIQNR